jgi:hypothetical protein
MSQHDYVLANANGPTFRVDANALALAIVTQNAGPIAPTPSFANQFWYNTGTGFLMKRDNANTVWQVLFQVDSLGNYTFAPGANDRNVIGVRNAANQMVVVLRVDSSGNGRVIVEDLNSVQRAQIIGFTTGGKMFLDGDENTGKQIAPILSLPALNLAGTTGQTVAIPSGATAIDLHFRHVVQPGIDSMVVQLGTVSGINGSGYVSTSSAISAGLTLAGPSGFPVRMGVGGTAAFGTMRIGIADAPTHPTPTWVSSHVATYGGDGIAGGGAIALSSQLTQLRVSATNAFTTGVILVQVRF